MDPVSVPIPCFRKIHFNILIPPTRIFLKLFLPFRLCSWTSERIFNLLLPRHNFLPSRLPSSDQPNNFWRRVQFMKPHMQFSKFLCSFLSITFWCSHWLQWNTENSVLVQWTWWLFAAVIVHAPCGYGVLLTWIQRQRIDHLALNHLSLTSPETYQSFEGCIRLTSPSFEIRNWNIWIYDAAHNMRIFRIFFQYTSVKEER